MLFASTLAFISFEAMISNNSSSLLFSIWPKILGFCWFLPSFSKLATRSYRSYLSVSVSLSFSSNLLFSDFSSCSNVELKLGKVNLVYSISSLAGLNMKSRSRETDLRKVTISYYRHCMVFFICDKSGFFVVNVCAELRNFCSFLVFLFGVTSKQRLGVLNRPRLIVLLSVVLTCSSSPLTWTFNSSSCNS